MLHRAKTFSHDELIIEMFMSSLGKGMNLYINKFGSVNYCTMQIFRGGKLSQLQRLVEICGKTFMVASVVCAIPF